MRTQPTYKATHYCCVTLHILYTHDIPTTLHTILLSFALVGRGAQQLALVEAKRAEAARAEEEAEARVAKARMASSFALVRLTLGRDYDLVN